MLKVTDLSVAYGSITALRGISFEITEGEVVAVIGPNGAGKSTLLLSIAGVLKPRSGRIEFAGRNITGKQAEALVSEGISLVPEGRHIFGSLTVAENLALGATVRRDRQAIASDIDRVLAMFPVLKDRYRQRANKLSGGEQQMLALGRAMLARPRLLLLDEPSLGLAPLIVNQVYQSIMDLRQSGVTVLVVEQNVTRALAVADRTYVLSFGAIAMSGRSTELAGTAAFDTAYFGVSREVEQE
ncbi:branched-chain amino acid transport system ATP-binding protein [Mesorhizobium soli]|uniref:ABC transporter ATP-binding protein n=1 Tax=Pseudaminobacter soli (ex Li et al. 2025) TaxID=1295366 RepID=UPI0024740083|nr:ABC transporter ATP-binding protein [Mesorhizobium soli]MDH6235027.1 branched-chain amino acid transport system ATP-binding protein [Mesorhizobium soli]